MLEVLEGRRGDPPNSDAHMRPHGLLAHSMLYDRVQNLSPVCQEPFPFRSDESLSPDYNQGSYFIGFQASLETDVVYRA